MPTRVACYYRISDDPQGREEGVDRQRADCLARAEREGWEVVSEFRENDTGASRYSRKKRTEYAKLLDHARAGEYDVILAYSNSRLTRRPEEFHDLIRLHDEHGVKVRTIVSGDDDLSTADGRMVARIKADVDAAEAERISERVRRQKSEKQAKYGFSSGTRPFGFLAPAKGDTVLTVNEPEAQLIRDGAARVIGGGSVASLVRDWNAGPITGVRGKSWRRDTVRKVLMADRNSPEILDADTAATVRGILSDNARTYARGSAPVHLLSGIAECGICGSRMVYRKMSGRHPGYGCETTEGHNTIREKHADAVVTLSVVQWYFMGRKDPATEDRPAHRSIEQIQHDRAVVMGERADIEAAINAKAVTLKGMMPTLTGLSADLDRLDSELEQVRQMDAHENLTEASVVEAEAILTAGLPVDPLDGPAPFSRAVKIRESWDAMAIERKRELLRASFQITISSGRNGYGRKRLKVLRNGIDLTADDTDIPFE